MILFVAVVLSLLFAISPASSKQTTSSNRELDERSPKPKEPEIAEASDEAELAMATFQAREGLKVELFAAEPTVANPVAIHVDSKGRVFVCETFRQELGVEDNREHPEWMDEELAAQTVQDRIDYIRKYEPNVEKEYNDQDDRIRLLVDTNKDGAADQSTVFSNRYNAIEDGTGAGVLTVGDDVFYANIPHLWRLRDKNNDGVADSRKSLINGFGVRFAFRGHDLHGLILGPDRRLYFSVGDRGYNVSPEIKDPASGAVFSCELDGSDLQVYATGLRNPQELAFDDYGNLFTGDNNSDSGDKARWVYVVPGGDSGWRMYYQYLPDRGPFNREKIWHPYHKDTPAYIVPPIANLADGPSGLAFYPGTGFSDYFKDRFFLCDFRGSAKVSGIRSFRMQPKGAGFEIVDSDKPIWGTLATDLDFGPDGRMYVSDWVFGWQGVGKGRIYTYHDPKNIQSEAAIQTKNILEKGFGETASEELIELLGHADRRVRYAAQFELVDRKESGLLLETFVNDARQGSENVLRTIHALWGSKLLANAGFYKWKMDDTANIAITFHILLSQFATQTVEDPEIRAQVVKFLGDLPDENSDWMLKFIVPVLNDPNPRVRYMAALAVGKIGDWTCVNSIAEFLAENADADAFLRHAGIMALSGIMSRMSNSRQRTAAYDLLRHESKFARLAAVAAFRKVKSPLVARFLEDEDDSVVLEATRAIHDLPLGSASMQSLAKLIERPAKLIERPAKLSERPLEDDALIRRVLNANVILGTQVNAVAVATFATDSNRPLPRRIDALELLGKWTNPDNRDYVLGDWRPMAHPRDSNAAKFALDTIRESAIADSQIMASYIDACNTAKVTLPVSTLASIVTDNDLDEAVRISALNGIQAADSKQVEEYSNLILGLSQLLDQLPDRLFRLVLDRLTDLDSEKAFEAVKETVESEVSPQRKQFVLGVLSKFGPAQTESILLSLLKRMKAGQLEPEVFLDVMVAAEKSNSKQVKDLLSSIRSQPTKLEDQSLAQYAYTLHGGDAEAGKKLFFEQTDLSCLRCHTVDGTGGSVGPELSAIGLQKSREYLLQSIVNPNHVIAEGYNQSIVLTDEGQILTGIKKEEDDETLTLMDKDGALIPILKDAIEGVKVGKSSMPEDLVEKLTLFELRDLVEYLANRKNEESKPVEPKGH